ncbi:RHS repeat-associated core domain-containing protein [Pseudomonas putida CSV86]|uniref:RHS repeat-associated core domain-containing protein n=1 Tax=Pseudomonas bharatica CSV86 TaxID=1005395 RepID=L1LU20_9PSED|nr:RHS repeat-associated core domain-containing protein [Pseudomonas bharatica]NNJ15323.1 RHS repeat-associated core domain-containing protein [Pseudomonas bharatica CSV86]
MSVPPDTFATGAPRCRLGFNAEYVERHGVQILGSYRAYSPVLMRFQNPDNQSPFARGGLNAYAYCHGDPVNLADPTGHFALALQTRRYLWLTAVIGFATAAIAGIGAAGMKKSKSRDAAIAIAGIGLALGIAAAAPLAINKFQSADFRAPGRWLLTRMRYPQRETPPVVSSASVQGVASSGHTTPGTFVPSTPPIEPNASPTPQRLPDGIAPTYPIASLIDFDGLPSYLYATDPYFKRRYHQLIEGPPPASSPESIRKTSLKRSGDR